jgi:hypothetical protein
MKRSCQTNAWPAGRVLANETLFTVLRQQKSCKWQFPRGAEQPEYRSNCHARQAGSSVARSKKSLFNRAKCG